MKIRFQADQDLDSRITRATIRLDSEIDFKTAHEAGLPGLLDPDVLAYAAADQRLLARAR